NERPPCCPFHCYGTYDPSKDKRVLRIFEKCADYTRRKLLGVPLVIANRKLIIHESNVKVEGDKIHFLQGPSAEPLPPINFAACWNNEERPIEYIGVAKKVETLRLLIPPINFVESEDGFHLVLDFFRNDWMIEVKENRLPIPRIMQNAEAGVLPFFDLVN